MKQMRHAIVSKRHEALERERREYLTVPELAARLHVEKKTVYNWNALGVGPPVHKFGHGCRYRRTEVEEWERSRRRDPRRWSV